MKIPTPLKDLTVTDAQPYNTCNGWGFGGAVGTIYTLDSGHRVMLGKALFRHLPSVPVCSVFTPSGRKIIDVDRKQIAACVANES